MKNAILCLAVAVFLSALVLGAQNGPGSSALPSYPINIHLTGTAAQVVKATPGTLHTLSFGTLGASAVVTIFDLPGASCTGTPVTNIKSIITLPASGGLPGTTPLSDGQFANGICIQATVATDMTAVAK